MNLLGHCARTLYFSPVCVLGKLTDILDSIQEIEDRIDNVEAVNFRENHVLIHAVSHAFLKITEATKDFLRSDIALPSNEPWIDIYSLGNQLRHGYFSIDQDQILHIATQDLLVLKKPRVTLS